MSRNRISSVLALGLVLVAQASIEAGTLAHYRFEDDDLLFNEVTGDVDGEVIGLGFDEDIPTESIPLTGDPNERSLLVTENGFALFEEPFVFHGDDDGLALTPNATVEFFIKAHRQVPSPEAQPFAPLIWTRDDDGETRNRFRIFIGFFEPNPADGIAEVGGIGADAVDPEGTAYPISTTSHGTRLGNWYHIAIVRRQGGGGSRYQYQWYINGQVDGFQTQVREEGLPDAELWTIGGGPGGAEYRIDELRFSDAALAPAEFLIQGVWNPTPGPNPSPGLVNPDSSRFNIQVQHFEPDENGIPQVGGTGGEYTDPSGHLHILSTTSHGIPLGTWTHVAVVRTDLGDGSHRYDWFINGGFDAFQTQIDQSPNLPDSRSWSIGGRPASGLTALVDEVRFSGAALTPDLFLNTIPEATVTEDTIAYYRFEEDTTDETGNGPDGQFLMEEESEAGFSNDRPLELVGDQINDFSLRVDDCSYLSFDGHPFVFEASGSGDNADATLEWWMKVTERGPEGRKASIFWTGDSETSVCPEIVEPEPPVTPPTPPDGTRDRYSITLTNFPNAGVGGEYRDPDGGLVQLSTTSNGRTYDEWSHVAIVRTDLGADGHRYDWYFDGNLDGFQSQTDTDPFLPSGTTWTIGGGPTYPLNALIDEVRFSDQALTPDQFIGAANDIGEGVAYYRFEEGAGTNLADTVSGDVHGSTDAAFSTDTPSLFDNRVNDSSLDLSAGMTATFEGQPFVFHEGASGGDASATIEFFIKPRTGPDGQIASIFWSTTETAPESATIAHYRFEEGQGTEVTAVVDDMLDGPQLRTLGDHNATYSDDAPDLPGQENNFSLSIDGGTFATILDQPFVFHVGGSGDTPDATLEFFFKGPDPVDHTSIFWTRPDGDDVNRFNVSINPGGAFCSDFRGPTGEGAFPINGECPAFRSDTWQHMAVVRKARGSNGHEYTYYLDGTLVEGSKRVVPPHENLHLPDGTGWTIGGRPGFPITMLIDEIRFSDGALTPDQFLIAGDTNSVGPFTRGDCDGNGTVGGSPTEAIVLLNFAFRGAGAPGCLAACDAEANGSIGITDALRILRFAFLGVGMPDPPFPDCVASDLESDLALGCETPIEDCP